VTEHPTTRWTGEQIIQAFPDDSNPRYRLRDRDSIYGEKFRERIGAIGDHPNHAAIAAAKVICKLPCANSPPYGILARHTYQHSFAVV
jgi:hypothetical protein